jgi:membrane associated rhomboid family serine protease
MVFNNFASKKSIKALSMRSIIDDIKQKYKDGNLLIKVIFVNVGIYLAMMLINVTARLFIGGDASDFVEEYLFPFLALNTSITSLLFKPWTLLTHQFVHSLDVWHLAGNMILLYFLGNMFLSYFSQKQFFGLYILSGLVGALSLIVISKLSPFFTSELSAVGASASVMGIAIAVCAHAPKNEVFLFGLLKVQLQWVGLFLLISDLIFFYDGNTGGHVAHLGGAVTGFWFTSKIKKGKDITKRINTIIALISNFVKSLGNKSKLKVAHSNVREMNDDEYNEARQATQEEIDAILDKISKNGYESLSAQEKDFLFRYSQK